MKRGQWGGERDEMDGGWRHGGRKRHIVPVDGRRLGNGVWIRELLDFSFDYGLVDVVSLECLYRIFILCPVQPWVDSIVSKTFVVELKMNL